MPLPSVDDLSDDEPQPKVVDSPKETPAMTPMKRPASRPKAASKKTASKTAASPKTASKKAASKKAASKKAASKKAAAKKAASPKAAGSKANDPEVATPPPTESADKVLKRPAANAMKRPACAEPQEGPEPAKKVYKYMYKGSGVWAFKVDMVEKLRDACMNFLANVALCKKGLTPACMWT